MIYLLNQRLPSEKAYGIQVSKMCEAFGRTGVDLELVVPYRVNSNRNLFEYYSIEQNFKFKKIFSPDFYLPGKFDRLAFWLKNFISALVLSIYATRSKNQIIYSRDELLLYLLTFLSKKNLIFEAHGFSKRRKLFYERFMNNNVKIVAITEGLKKDFVGFGFKPDDILVAHDGVDLADFNNLVKLEEVKTKFAMPLDRPIVLYAGQLYYHKGADVVAEAARSCPEAHFIFLGGTLSDVKEFRKRFGHLSNITIAGPRPRQEALALMVVADILTLPNREESGHTSPLKLFEYMAAGKPIVASSTPALLEVLNDRNALLIKPGKPELLVLAIRRILEDRQLAHRISNQAKQDVQKYTWQTRAAAIKNFIQAS